MLWRVALRNWRHMCDTQVIPLYARMQHLADSLELLSLSTRGCMEVLYALQLPGLVKW